MKSFTNFVSVHAIFADGMSNFYASKFFSLYTVTYVLIPRAPLTDVTSINK